MASPYTNQTQTHLAAEASSIFSTQCANCSILALLVWDFIIQFPEEVKYIWSSPRSAFTLIWVVLRYPLIVANVMVVIAFSTECWSPKFCIGWAITRTMLTWLSLFTCRMAWFLRTYLLYERASWLVWASSPFIVAESTVVLLAMTRIRYHHIPVALPQLCITTPRYNVFVMLAWVIPFLLDTCFTGLCLIRASRVAAKTKTPLTQQLVRDGFFFYVALTAVYGVALTLYGTQPATLGMISQAMVGILSLTSSRFLLDLRMLKSADEERKADSRATEISTCFSQVDSFGILTGLDNFLDHFDLDDIRINADAPVGTPPRTPRIPHTSRTPAVELAAIA
ncbi:hypothetical protein BKA62DRAFT_698649 [Auriculariales sp. MPI-PUGE-AT-0066]|nr:hypothetical protein BKA62DRAFT_698649 [Auriculariales sp. MPI-PUGE-AT-0066]